MELSQLILDVEKGGVAPLNQFYEYIQELKTRHFLGAYHHAVTSLNDILDNNSFDKFLLNVALREADDHFWFYARFMDKQNGYEIGNKVLEYHLKEVGHNILDLFDYIRVNSRSYVGTLDDEELTINLNEPLKMQLDRIEKAFLSDRMRSIYQMALLEAKIPTKKQNVNNSKIKL